MEVRHIVLKCEHSQVVAVHVFNPTSQIMLVNLVFLGSACGNGWIPTCWCSPSLGSPSNDSWWYGCAELSVLLLVATVADIGFFNFNCSGARARNRWHWWLVRLWFPWPTLAINDAYICLCGLCLTKLFALQFFVCIFPGKPCSRRQKQELKRSHGSAPTVLEATTFQILFRVHHLQVSVFELISGLCGRQRTTFRSDFSPSLKVGSRDHIQVIMLGGKSPILKIFSNWRYKGCMHAHMCTHKGMNTFTLCLDSLLIYCHILFLLSLPFLSVVLRSDPGPHTCQVVSPYCNSVQVASSEMHSFLSLNIVL